MKRVFRPRKKGQDESNAHEGKGDSLKKSSVLESSPSFKENTDVPKNGSTMSMSSSSLAAEAEAPGSTHGEIRSVSVATSAPTSLQQPTKLQTNVQVCARIRPQMVHRLSKNNESFFKNTPKRRTFLPIPSSKKKFLSSPQPTEISQSGKKSNTVDDDGIVAWDVSEGNTTASQSSKTQKVQGRTDSYTLDKVFGTSSSTQQIYKQSVSPLVQAAMEGFHSTVCAYGQTGTGKTYTMTGTKDSPGLIPLCVRDCFRYVQENMCDEPREYLIRLSYLEVYNEHIRDLLSSKAPPEPVRLFDGPNGLIIRGLKEEVVTSPERVFQLLKQGDKRRQVGATHMNQHSSRSHVMVRLWIESSPSLVSSNQDTRSNLEETRVSSLSLVDLAGSESVRLNGAERREEGHYINKSLMTLGQVVLSLSDAATNNNKTNPSQQQHIPYRDSKLTRLLQPSLSGNAQMLLLCCIHPSASHLEESHNTFKFATRAKRIEQRATIQTAQDKDETLLQTYREEIQDLKQQLAEAKEQKRLLENQQQRQLQSPSATIAMSTSSGVNAADVDSAKSEIHELVQAIQKMEKLILKSRPGHPEQSNREAPSGRAELDDALARLLQSDDEEDEGEDLLLDDDSNGGSSNYLKSSTKLTSDTPYHSNDTEDQLHTELTRIRGLLDSVLQKRGVVGSTDASLISPDKQDVRRNLDFSTPSPTSVRSPDRSLSEELQAGMNLEDDTLKDVDEEKKTEVETLRKQLEMQERTTNLRKADSSFLQAQLKEKDKLLEEVSNLLEAVEQRQVHLERENEALKREVESFKSRNC